MVNNRTSVAGTVNTRMHEQTTIVAGHNVGGSTRFEVMPGGGGAAGVFARSMTAGIVYFRDKDSSKQIGRAHV